MTLKKKLWDCVIDSSYKPKYGDCIWALFDPFDEKIVGWFYNSR